jgi:GT2 family glycosyltransferase
MEQWVDVALVDVFLVDNASTDETVALVREGFPWVQVVENEGNLGFGAGHNCVLPSLASTYHLVINPDIVFVEDAVMPLASYLAANPDVVMVTPRILNPDGSMQQLPRLRPRLRYVAARRFERRGRPGGWARRLSDEYTMANEEFAVPTQLETCTGSFFAIRTAVLRELGGFDERFFLYFEDNDLSCRASAKGRIMLYPDTQVVHHYERAALKSKRAFLWQLRSMLRFFGKYGW